MKRESDQIYRVSDTERSGNREEKSPKTHLNDRNSQINNVKICRNWLLDNLFDNLFITNESTFQLNRSWYLILVKIEEKSNKTRSQSLPKNNWLRCAQLPSELKICNRGSITARNVLKW